jgi:hypothetical protein
LANDRIRITRARRASPKRRGTSAANTPHATTAWTPAARCRNGSAAYGQYRIDDGGPDADCPIWATRVWTTPCPGGPALASAPSCHGGSSQTDPLSDRTPALHERSSSCHLNMPTPTSAQTMKLWKGELQ